MSKQKFPFSPEEDVEIWRFTMEDHPGYGRNSMWNLFIKRTGSRRPQVSLNVRFRDYLLPHLPFTSFHTETKLKFCVQYKIQVDHAFLEALEEDAYVILDDDGFVTAYTMKPSAGRNIDQELDDEAFLRMTSPIVKKHAKFTVEEDAEIWEYLIENHENPDRGTEQFWKELIKKLKWQRTTRSVVPRFNKVLAPQLANTDFDLDTKMKLYKAYDIVVDPEFLKILKEQYDVKIDKKGCIYWYRTIGTTHVKRKRRNPWENCEHDHNYHKRVYDIEVMEVHGGDIAESTILSAEDAVERAKMVRDVKVEVDEEDVTMYTLEDVQDVPPIVKMEDFNEDDDDLVFQVDDHDSEVSTASPESKNENSDGMTWFLKGIMHSMEKIAKSVGSLAEDVKIIKEHMVQE